MSNEQLKKHIERGVALWKTNDVDGALAENLKALEIDPQNADAMTNTGTAYWAKGKQEEATKYFLKAIEINPGHMTALMNVATLYQDNGDLESAEIFANKARAVRPLNADVLWRLGVLRLANGDYLSGFDLYEEGLGYDHIRGKCPPFKIGQWDGSYCNRLVIWHEQGLGDTLQFVRYAQYCKQTAKKVFVLCPKELVRILKTCPWIDDAVTGLDEGDFDAQISIMSLPYLFKTTLETVPANVPYLGAEPIRCAYYEHKMPKTDKLKVGIVWGGNPRKSAIRFQIIDTKRSSGIEELAPLFDVPNVQFYSLQKGDYQSQIEPYKDKLIDLMGDVDDFWDTAAIISNLDLVISVDTSVVHLAGALGKPVWVLSRYDACWRWLRNKPDNPWYPTAKVYGQHRPKDWSGVVQQVKRDLENYKKC